MKKTLLFCALSVLAFSLVACGKRPKKVHGDNNIVQHEISISEYNRITTYGFGEVFYTQNDSMPAYFKIEIDSNLIEYLNIAVEGKSLKIKPIDKISVLPTKCIIHTNSKDLKAATINGSGNINGIGKLVTSDFEAAIAGGGSITFDSLEVYSTTAKIAGSGDVILSGTATKSSYNIAGSGKILAKELTQDTVKCKIAGSGDIEVNVKNVLKNSIAGSGNIKYIGNPTITNSIAGSGNISPIE